MVPFRTHKQKALAEIRKAFPAASFVRITLLFTAVFIPIRYALPRWLPELDVNWIELFLISIVSMLVLIASTSLVAFIPPRITVSQKGVMVQEGQHCVWHLFKDIAAIRVDEEALPLPLLRISFLKQRDEKVYPIVPTVSAETLRTLIDGSRFS
jgi:hypothetical protein